MHHYIPTFDSIDATDRSWLVEMEVDTLTTLNRDCRKGVLGVDGYGDVFTSYEFLWGVGWKEEGLKTCLVASYPGYFLYKKEPGYKVNCLGDRSHVSYIPMSLT